MHTISDCVYNNDVLCVVTTKRSPAQRTSSSANRCPRDVNRNVSIACACVYCMRMSKAYTTCILARPSVRDLARDAHTIAKRVYHPHFGVCVFGRVRAFARPNRRLALYCCTHAQKQQQPPPLEHNGGWGRA